MKRSVSHSGVIKSALTACIVVVGVTSVWPTHPPSSSFGEAPEWVHMVKQDRLPPVKQRLPPQPLVVPVYEQIGQYGGGWRRLMRGTADLHALNRLNYEMLLRFPPNPQDDILPNIIEHWTFNEDLTALTLNVRQGIRWSDGAPFSGDDILFAWERLMNDRNITLSVPSYWRPGGEVMKMTQLDRYTIHLAFARPYPLILQYLAFRAPQWPYAQERDGLYAPKHYLSPALDRTRIENGIEVPDPDYEELERLAYDFNPERPVLTPWRIALWDAGNRLVAVRNPYYWKVDPAGNQLPYIDEIHHEVFFNRELLNFRIITGELDMQIRHVRGDDWPLLQGFRERGDYRTLQYLNTGSGTSGVCLNLEFRDTRNPERGAAYRQLFQTREFRQALSLATDRKMIREIAHKGRTTMPTFDFIEESGLHVGDPEIDRWLVYDPDRANRMLDEIGLDQRDNNGFRMMPTENGDWIPISIIIEVAGDPTTIGPLEMVCAQWAEVGIRATIRPQDRTLNDLRVLRAGEHMATTGGDGGSYPLLNASMKFGVAFGTWSHFYALWRHTRHLEQPAGVAPPPIIQRLHDLYEKMVVTNDREQLRAYAEEAARINGEEVFFIPMEGAGYYVGSVRNNMRNVPEHAAGTWVESLPGNLNPATFFFKQGVR